MNIVALHGFLGQAHDWDYFLDLTSTTIGRAQDFQTWAESFNNWAESSIAAPRALLGYSMGGRLALHALLQRPNLWSQGILVSTHPGLKTQREKKLRYQTDCQWAERFLHDPWPLLMQDWENQPIFALTTHRFDRSEEDYQRDDLALHLVNFSLGLQDDLRYQIRKLSIPLLWVTGENDHAFSSLAQEMVMSHP